MFREVIMPEDTKPVYSPKDLHSMAIKAILADKITPDADAPYLPLQDPKTHPDIFISKSSDSYQAYANLVWYYRRDKTVMAELKIDYMTIAVQKNPQIYEECIAKSSVFSQSLKTTLRIVAEQTRAEAAVHHAPISPTPVTDKVAYIRVAHSHTQNSEIPKLVWESLGEGSQLACQPMDKDDADSLLRQLLSREGASRREQPEENKAAYKVVLSSTKPGSYQILVELNDIKHAVVTPAMKAAHFLNEAHAPTVEKEGWKTFKFFWQVDEDDKLCCYGPTYYINATNPVKTMSGEVVERNLREMPDPQARGAEFNGVFFEQFIDNLSREYGSDCDVFYVKDPAIAMLAKLDESLHPMAAASEDIVVSKTPKIPDLIPPVVSSTPDLSYPQPIPVVANLDQGTKLRSSQASLSNVVEKTESSSVKYKKQLADIRSTMSPIELFREEHKKLFDKSKAGFGGYFRNTKLTSKMDLTQIIEHAKNHDNRSRQACINLGWMDKNGTLNKDTVERPIPQEVQDAYASTEVESRAQLGGSIP